MKVDRRTFAKGMAFAGGGALGILLSPAPWYMVRDMAFWTQNWPWVPVPPSGKPSLDKAICGICEGGCGVKVQKIGNRLVRIDGDKEHPVNRGSVCPVGTAALQTLYGPARVRFPLKQIGTRKNPKWEPISWSEAIEEVTRKIKELRGAKNSHALACITNNADNTTNQLFERFLQAVGSRNFMKMASGRDAQRIVFGLMQGMKESPSYDIENARHILSFGCSLFDGWGAAGRMYRAYSRWFADPDNPAVEIVQIEPNLSTTAIKASRWVPLNPGTEAALALGIAHVLIENELYDKPFVKKYCFGFDDWKDSDGEKHKGFKTEVLARYSPQTVESITGVPAKDIEEIARQFAMNKPSLALGGRGNGELFKDLYELMAVHSLNALVGNINRRGGILAAPEVPVRPLGPVRMDEEARRGWAVARSDKAGSSKYPFTRYLPDNISSNGIRVLFVHEVNPAYALPDRQIAKEIFDGIPYIVSFSSHMDESTVRADLVLPAPMPFERWDDQLGVPGLQYPVYNLQHPLIPPVYQTRSAGDILIEIARGLGGTVAESFPWDSFVELLRNRAEGLYRTNKGMINTPETMAGLEEHKSSDDFGPSAYSSFSSFWGQLVENSCWFDPAYKYDSPAKILKTPSRQFEFYSRQLQSAFHFAEDIRCMPHYGKPFPKPEGFNLTIMPENIIAMAENGMGTPPFLIKELGDDVLKGNDIFVQINPITARRLKLQEGDSVILESSLGRVNVRIHICTGVREGVVLIPLGFGHTAFDKFLRDKGVNAHQILEAKKDSISGLPLWWATPGKITKV